MPVLSITQSHLHGFAAQEGKAVQKLLGQIFPVNVMETRTAKGNLSTKRLTKALAMRLGLFGFEQPGPIGLPGTPFALEPDFFRRPAGELDGIAGELQFALRECVPYDFLKHAHLQRMGFCSTSYRVRSRQQPGGAIQQRVRHLRVGEERTGELGAAGEGLPDCSSRDGAQGRSGRLASGSGQGEPRVQLRASSTYAVLDGLPVISRLGQPARRHLVVGSRCGTCPTPRPLTLAFRGQFSARAGDVIGADVNLPWKSGRSSPRVGDQAGRDSRCLDYCPALSFSTQRSVVSSQGFDIVLPCAPRTL